jgi:hypothetical protein
VPTTDQSLSAAIRNIVHHLAVRHIVKQENLLDVKTRQSTVYFAYFALVCEQLGRTSLTDELVA